MRLQFGGALRAALGQHGCAHVDAQMLEEMALRHRAMDAQPGLARDIGQHREIDMGGEVALAWIGEGIGELVVLHRLQRVAQGWAFIAIVDDDRDAALARDPAGKGIARGGAGLRHFDDRAFGGLRGDRRQARFDPAIARHRHEAALFLATDHHPFAPFVTDADHLPHGQGIEKFIGDHQQWRLVGQAFDAVMMDDMGNLGALPLAQGRAGFDEMDARGDVGAFHRAQRIAGQRAATRPEFDIERIGAPARSQPDIGQAQADQFAEHLTDFRGGGEVPLQPQRIARAIIMLVRLAHIMSDGDRPAGIDLAGQALGQAHRAGQGVS